VLGDRVAHRMGETARDGVRQAEDLRGRLETGVRDFLVREDRQLVGRDEMRTLTDAMRELEAIVGRLESKLGRDARA